MSTVSPEQRPASDTTATLAALAADVSGRHRGAAQRRWTGDRWEDVSFTELGLQAADLAAGLMALGVERGDRVAIFGATRPEWTVADLAALHAGATVVPIYHTSSAEEVEFLLSHSGAKVAICEDETLAGRVADARRSAPALEHVVVMEGAGMRLDDVAALSARVDPDALGARMRAVRPEDPCTIVYTSGTTGRPKGCVLTHANVRANMTMLASGVGIGPGDRVFAFLPLAHVLTRMTQFTTLDGGGTLAYWRGDQARVLDDLAELRPTHLPSVPRVFQKIHTKATSATGAKATLLERSVATGRRVRALERAGERPGRALALRFALADRLVLRKVRGVFGGEVERAFSGGAPIAAEILEFFDACGVEVLEGWGMTECSAAGTLNRPGHARPGTVGPPLPGCDVRIADDGEVLIRGPHVFAGYFRDPDATAATIVDGWLHTGDLGAVDPDGSLRITGRKKEILITSSGKNVAPAPIENALTNAPILSQAMVAGEARPYLVALLTLDPEEAARLSDGAADPRSHPAVLAAVEAAVAAANARFARIEQVKRWHVLDGELTVDAGELTPTLKVKRPVVTERHREALDGLYAG